MNTRTHDTLLKVTDLTVNYGAIQAIKGIEFSVNRGEIVSLIGSNGAGKTSILSALSGVVSCAGKIVLNGKDITRMQPHLRVTLGLAHAPEGRGIFPNLSVLENLLLGAFSVKDKAKISTNLDKAFERFPRLRERRSQMAGTLSGGEQQMLAIGRALMISPEIILLDEPSLGLAPLIVAQIFDVIAELNSVGVTILLVEQNARLALKKSHRAYVLETGTITITGNSQDLLQDPQVQQAYLGG